MVGIVIGAGIGGLTTAVALRRLGIAADVYEAAPVLEPMGAGIWMAPNAMKVFARLGLADEIGDAGLPVDRVAVLDQRLKPLLIAPQDAMAARHGFRITAIHRGVLQCLIRGHLPADFLHLGKRLVALRQEERVTAVFDDGTEATAEFLIGADGLNSAVRAQLFGNIPTRYAGSTCWRGVTEFDLPASLKRATSEIEGYQRRFGIAEIKAGTVYWFAVKTAPRGERDSPEETKPRLLEEFKDFADPVAQIIAATSLDRVVRNDLCDLPPRRPWSKGAACLIGDAAHPMTPDLGQGGAQAVEDAYYLSAELARQPKPAEAFAAFAARRYPKVEAIVKRAYRFNRIMHAPVAPWLRNLALRMTPPSLAEKMMDQIYDVPEV